MKAAVQLANVSVSAGGKVRLSGLTQSLPMDGVTALIGPNGAGKSLLLRALHDLVPLSGGKIRWAEALGGDRRALMRQRPEFLRRSTRENLIFALKLAGWKRKPAETRADETLEWLGLTDVAGQLAPTLSPGYQTRLAMARALAIEPGVLLLDEPTASLDPEATLAFEGLVNFVKDKGTKVILVSHSLGQVRRLAQDVLLLDQGQSLEFGTTEAFFSAPKHPKAQAFLHAAGFWHP